MSRGAHDGVKKGGQAMPGKAGARTKGRRRTEDHDMMRPFIVMPAAALEAMDMPEMWRPFFIEEGQDQ